MRKVLKTVKLLFWGNLAVIVIGLYIGLTVVIGTTIAFIESLKEIWFYEDND